MARYRRRLLLRYARFREERSRFSMLRRHIRLFWRWYERYSTLNIGISAGLFTLQLVHLFWLTTDVIATRLLGYALFHPTGIWELLIIIVDYLEIPTILSVSLIYINT